MDVFGYYLGVFNNDPLQFAGRGEVGVFNFGYFLRKFIGHPEADLL